MIRIEAPCKVNWFLEITGKRPDGYHTLETVFQTISLADTLTLRSAERLSMSCSDRSLATDETNLVMRAALGLQALLRESRGARIHLAKRVPMGAGLGGGSSDAAAALIGLQRLWRRKAPKKALHALATRLGADVPFFLEKGLCTATGIGDRLKKQTPFPRQWLVLVFPGFGVATKEAYSQVRLPWPRLRSMKEFVHVLQKRKTAELGTALFNRFEELVFPGRSKLTTLKDRLVSLGCEAALMSGSGSSIFGLAASEAKAKKVLRLIRREYPTSWAVHTL